MAGLSDKVVVKHRSYCDAWHDRCLQTTPAEQCWLMSEHSPQEKLAAQNATGGFQERSLYTFDGEVPLRQSIHKLPLNRRLKRDAIPKLRR
jgi:hypothetical protein